MKKPATAINFNFLRSLNYVKKQNSLKFDSSQLKGSVVASSSVDGCVILWNISDGQKTDILYQPNDESIRNGMFSPDGSIIATTDDTGLICIFGQDKVLKKMIKGVHEETVPTLAFSKDSKIMLTACNMGNVRLFFNDFEGKLINVRRYDLDIIEPFQLI